ncbi:CYFA0S11e03510g1_1 [Cyberlindnera fabianii]|uniref:CYFA0S11e03510g1_1 n=1 Tax=Cyberlindnera fabianii TaxID=36022 RepID=A0A061B049_CYBFA|nr:CYFA0S11e03510g1_1 [Cyberlindnera fabianii]
MADAHLFSQVTLPSLFVQPPAPPESTTDPIGDLLSLLQNIDSAKPYSTLISITYLTRQVITTTSASDENIATLYALWELHLTALIFAHELTLAQQEAKRLSIALDSIVKSKNPKSSNSAAASLFPLNTPLSLRSLLVRLRSSGPTVQFINEGYALLWDQRVKYTETKDNGEKEKIQAVISVLSYGIGAALVAKREYGTFLSLACSVDNPQMWFAATLVSLMKGDWDEANSYFGKLDDLTDCVEALSEVLATVNPVLDSKSDDTGLEVELKIEKLEDLFALIKDQMITGRTVCALCAMFELNVRDSEKTGSDLFGANLEGPMAPLMRENFKLWRRKASKVYTFE